MARRAAGQAPDGRDPLVVVDRLMGKPAASRVGSVGGGSANAPKNYGRTVPAATRAATEPPLIYRSTTLNPRAATSAFKPRRSVSLTPGPGAACSESSTTARRVPTSLTLMSTSTLMGRVAEGVDVERMTLSGQPLRPLHTLHIPAGGRRFRPTMEDFVEFLLRGGFVTPTS